MVRIELGVIGDHARLEVCDNGPGVDEQDHDRIFEAYHRAHDRRGQPASVGLGLTVSKQLANLMGGDLAYFRRDGWSVFSLSLPLADGRGSSSEPRKGRLEDLGTPRGGVPGKHGIHAAESFRGTFHPPGGGQGEEPDTSHEDRAEI